MMGANSRNTQRAKSRTFTLYERVTEFRGIVLENDDVAQYIRLIMNQIELTAHFGIPAEKLYKAWLSPVHHGAMSYGGEAHIDPVVGGDFDCGDGYVWGKTLELDPGRRLVQSWRTTDFAEDQPDTTLQVTFTDNDEGCTLTLVHNGFPEDQVADYLHGWNEFYLAPMRIYFGG